MNILIFCYMYCPLGIKKLFSFNNIWAMAKELISVLGGKLGSKMYIFERCLQLSVSNIPIFNKWNEHNWIKITMQMNYWCCKCIVDVIRKFVCLLKTMHKVMCILRYSSKICISTFYFWRYCFLSILCCKIRLLKHQLDK